MSSTYDVIEADNLEFLQGWWMNIHGHTLPECWLPPSKFYVVKDNVPVAFFWMAGMECAICYLGFPTISPKVRGEQRQNVYSVMCNKARNWAKEGGYNLIYISIQGEVAARNFQKHGFFLGDDEKGKVKATHLFMEAK